MSPKLHHSIHIKTYFEFVVKIWKDLNCVWRCDVFPLRTRSLPRRRSCSWRSSSTWRRKWFVFGSATAGRKRNASTPPAAPPLPCPARPRLLWRTKPPATARTWYSPPWIHWPFTTRSWPDNCFADGWMEVFPDFSLPLQISSHGLSQVTTSLSTTGEV